MGAGLATVALGAAVVDASGGEVEEAGATLAGGGAAGADADGMT